MIKVYFFEKKKRFHPFERQFNKIEGWKLWW